MNRTLLRRASLPVLIVSTLGLSACGSDSSSDSSSSTSSSAVAADCGKGTLNGEGSTAQKNAIDEVISTFGDSCSDLKVNYNATGSGNGVKQFNAGQVAFAGSDSALKAEKGEVAAATKRCKGNPAWNLPMVAGPIAVAYNVSGVDSLTLTPALLGKIFSGQIKTWNDPAIAKANPGVSLPAKAIKVFYRSDESGTTDNFTKYLKAASGGTWTADPAKAWPSTGAGEGRDKSAGVVDGVGSTDGGITYAEWSYAKDKKLKTAKIDNGGGAVELTGEAVGKALENAKQVGTGNDLSMKLDYTTKVKGAYPITLLTYEIACSKGLPADQTTALKGFLKYYADPATQKSLEGMGYAPLPAAIQAKVTKAIAAIS